MNKWLTLLATGEFAVAAIIVWKYEKKIDHIHRVNHRALDKAVTKSYFQGWHDANTCPDRAESTLGFTYPTH